MPRPGPRKYAPLTAYLAGLAEDEVTLTLTAMEGIIGAPLPPSAREATFWVNGPQGTFNVRPWVRAGWRVARTDLRGNPPTVTVVRSTEGPDRTTPGPGRMEGRAS
jgi:hypothetical protein